MNITGSFGADDRTEYPGIRGAFYKGSWYDCGAKGADDGFIM